VDVERVERALGRAGHLDPSRALRPTGRFDGPLRDAVKGYQKQARLKVDGLLNPQGPTAWALGRFKAPNAVRPRRGLVSAGAFASNGRLVEALVKSTDHRMPARDIAAAAQAGERGRAEVADLFAQAAARSPDTAARLHGEVAKRLDPELHRALFAAAEALKGPGGDEPTAPDPGDPDDPDEPSEPPQDPDDPGKPHPGDPDEPDDPKPEPPKEPDKPKPEPPGKNKCNAEKAKVGNLRLEIADQKRRIVNTENKIADTENRIAELKSRLGMVTAEGALAGTESALSIASRTLLRIFGSAVEAGRLVADATRDNSELNKQKNALKRFQEQLAEQNETLEKLEADLEEALEALEACLARKGGG